MGLMFGGMVLFSVSLEGTDGAGLRGGGELRCRGMESELTSCFFSCSLFFFSIRESYGRIGSEWVLVFPYSLRRQVSLLKSISVFGPEQPLL